MKTGFRHIALIGKHRSPEIAKPLIELAEFLERRGVEVSIDPITAEHVSDHRREVLTLEQIGKRADLAIVIGGDGTMLNIARTLAPFDVPLAGVNVGRLGFLTDVSIDTMFDTVGAMLDGQYMVEPRMLVAVQVIRRGDRIADMIAFNEVAVNKGAEGSLIELEVRIDRPVRLQPASRRTDRGVANRLHGLRTVLRRPDPAPLRCRCWPWCRSARTRCRTGPSWFPAVLTCGDPGAPPRPMHAPTSTATRTVELEEGDSSW